MIKLMYITNQPEIAQIAETAGVDRIFVDMEFFGKAKRQISLDTVRSHHTIEDISAIKSAVLSAQVLVRINPLHDALPNIPSSQEEIDASIAAGADILMLPFFKTVREVETFLSFVNGRTQTMLLVETPEAVARIDEILSMPGIDEVHIGLNDLSIGYGKRFMFELLSDGTVEQLCFKFRQRGLTYGFGGIASLGNGALPSEYIIKEHYRLGSTCAILSRSFCDVTKVQHIGIISATFQRGVREIRELEFECQRHADFFWRNEAEVRARIASVCQMPQNV